MPDHKSIHHAGHGGHDSSEQLSDEMESKSATFSSVIRRAYRVRYFLARPFQTKVLASILPVLPLPYIKDLPYVSLGQIVLLVPWLLIFMASHQKTFASPDVEGSGKFAEYAIVAAFLTANKANSVFNFLFGLSYERLVPIHNLYACLALISSTFHLYVAYVYGDDDHEDDDEGSGNNEEDRRLHSDESNFGLNGPTPSLWKFLWDGNTNLTGSIATICLTGLVILSFFRIIRKYLYEPWLYSHIVFSLGVLLFGVLHEATLLIFPFVWWMMDWWIGRFVVHSRVCFPTAATLTKLNHDVVKIEFRRTFHFEAGQFVRISIPSAGLTELSAHPITISSAPFQNHATLHIRKLGGWTKALTEIAESSIDIFVDGPYGHLSMDLTNYPIIVCIAGGIGVTPCESIARQVIFESKHQGRDLLQLRFVWAIRDTCLLQTLPTVATDGTMSLPLPADLEDTSYCSTAKSQAQEDLKFIPEIYLTNPESNNSVNTVGSFFCYQGRPDIPAILQATIATAQSKRIHRVAVITCGPVRLVQSVKKACRTVNAQFSCFQSNHGSPVRFDVHDEIFNY